MGFFKDKVVFFQQGLKEFRNTGSLFPTSVASALVMLEQVQRRPNKTYRILEVGPGTGSITKHLVPLISENSELTICEINPAFMQHVKDVVAELPNLQDEKKRITYFEGAVQDLPNSEPVDFIVCALPFLNFTPDLLEEIFEKLTALSHPETRMTFYQYSYVKYFRGLIGSKDLREKATIITAYLDSQLNTRLLVKKQVMWNIPPITVFTLNMSPILKPSTILEAKKTVLSNETL